MKRTCIACGDEYDDKRELAYCPHDPNPLGPLTPDPDDDDYQERN